MNYNVFGGMLNQPTTQCCHLLTGEAIYIQNKWTHTETGHLWCYCCLSSAVPDLSTFCISPCCRRYFSSSYTV